MAGLANGGGGLNYSITQGVWGENENKTMGGWQGNSKFKTAGEGVNHGKIV